MNSGTAEAVVVICHCNHNNSSTKMLESKHIGCVVYCDEVEAENSHSCTSSSQLARLIIAHTKLLYSILAWNSRLLMCCFHKYCFCSVGNCCPDFLWAVFNRYRQAEIIFLKLTE